MATQTDLVVLHGDIHHGNVLDFGESGWLAIDPKGLWGERGFDYANLFCNPGAPDRRDYGGEFTGLIAAVRRSDEPAPTRSLQIKELCFVL